jgi:hypothetical protein
MRSAHHVAARAMLAGLVVLAANARLQAQLPSALRPTGVTIDTEVANARVLSAREGTVLDPREILVVGYGVAFKPVGQRFGAMVRVHGSTLSRDLAYGDVGAQVDWGNATAEAGLAWRRGYDLTSGLAHGAVHRAARLGVLVRQPVHATPLTLQWRAGVYVPLAAGSGAEEPPRGWEGESALLYDWSRSPVTLRLGFRFERFRVNRMEQEVSMVHFGVTWRGLGAQ